MTLDKLIEAAVAGKLRVEGPGASPGIFSTTMVPLGADDPVGLTAEAYRMDLIDYRTVPWDEGLQQVKALIEERVRHLPKREQSRRGRKAR